MKQKALVLSGGIEVHDPELIGQRFKNMLEKEGFEVTNSDTLDCFSDKKALMDLDLIVPNWSFGDMDDVSIFNLSEAIESGVGYGGCHGICDLFRMSPEYKFMTGSNWVAHSGNKYYHHISDISKENRAYVQKHYQIPHGCWSTDFVVNIKRGVASPITEGIQDFSLHSEQYYLHVDPCINVLATTLVTTEGPHSANGPVEVPVVYTKLWGRGRVFYNSLGHNDLVFDIPEVEEITRRGFLWAARKR